MGDAVRALTREKIIIAPMPVGWAQTGSLTTGGSQTVQTQRIFKQPQEFTVTFDINAADMRVTAYCQATVTWSVCGVPMRRTFDVVAGVSISGVAEAVAVSVADVAPAGFTGGGSYSVTIQIAPEYRGPSQVPLVQSAARLALLNGASETVIGIPDGVTSLALFAANQDASSTALRVDLRIQSVFGDLLDVRVTPGQFYPLPSGANSYEVTNDGTKSVFVFPVFGVDG